MCCPASVKSGDWRALGQVAKFDNVVGLPGVAVSSINLYENTFWNGPFLIQTHGQTVPISVVANTYNNYAAYSTFDVVTIQQGAPAMTVYYADSTIEYFDLNPFYYACARGTDASIVGNPTSCTITAEGYFTSNGSDKDEAASESFSYKGKVLQLQSQMVQATLNSKFKGVKKVEFSVSNSLLVAGSVDTVSYTVYSSKKM
ncbi:hypothetical protein BCR34DRAFT_596133 [Clohesyomyces aquaticus]|uniref:Uncharacterized protein n=1 Tax=Clohesyomyces aquaticus TaxID=1231657 RepID=A0A1Y2A7U2_9PLEO|nr:hypothetical protein BCR34DRAFT_596133 [Clohesyomyces aquaticus]